jgi:putative membrane protein
MNWRTTAKLAITITFIAALFLSACDKDAESNGWPAIDTPVSGNVAIPDTPAVYTKNEDVYAKLQADGSVMAAYVVNSFAVKTGGTIADYGAYAAVENLTDLSAISNQRGIVSLQAAAGNFYYQGNMSQPQLPWQIKITYQLDGQAIAAADLAGASGKLNISIKTTENAAVDSVFYDNYLLQLTLTLDSESCRNIVAENASIADAGDQKKITFAVMPGTAGDLQLSADVTDFEMEGISIAAVPFAMEIAMPDTADITGGLDDLAGGIADLDGGVQDLSEGMQTLVYNSQNLASGSWDITDGLAQLSGNSSDLISGSAEILSALKQIDNSLQDADFSSLDQLAQLPAALDSLATALGQISGGLQGLETGFSGAYAALDSAIATVSGGISQQDLAALATANAGNSAFMTLLADYTAAQTIKGTYQQVKPAFAAVNNNLPTLIASLGQVQGGLDEMSSQLTASLGSSDLAGDLEELQDGIDELAANYKKFHSGLKDYTDGVDTLNDNYATFNDGLLQYLEGVASAGSGIGELADGSAELSSATQDMPDQVNGAVQEMQDQFDYSDFQLVSFIDARNEQIAGVQFVMTTEQIAVPEEQTPEQPEEQQGFFARLLALFQ